MIQRHDVTKVQSRNYSYSEPTRNREESSAPKQRTASSGSSWRDSNDYRKQYFEKNNGIAGKLFICSQCFKPMFDKSGIQVDHILPPSRVVFGNGQGRINTSLARLLNNSFNCAAICPKCNRQKSNKLGFVVVRGYFMKSLEVSANIAAYAIVSPFVVLSYGLHLISKLTRRK